MFALFCAFDLFGVVSWKYMDVFDGPINVLSGEYALMLSEATALTKAAVTSSGFMFQFSNRDAIFRPRTKNKI